MSMVCRVTTSPLWKQGSTYEIRIVLYESSNTSSFEKTEVFVEGKNLKFQSFERGSNCPQPVFQSGTSGNSQLNWNGRFQGAPPLSSPWTIVIKAQTNGNLGTDNSALIVHGYDEYFTTVTDQNTFEKKIRLTLADAQGVVSDPLTPKKVKAKTLGSNAILISWARVDYAESITIERATDSAFTTDVFSWDVGGSDTEYIDFATSGLDSTVPELDPETEYFYRLTSSNPRGESDPSSTVSATTVQTPANPNSPQNCRVTKASQTEITVTFDPISELVVQTDDGKVKLEPSYQARYSLAESGPYTDFDVFKPGKNIKITGLTPNTEYFVVVRASYEYAPDAVSSNSNEATATTKPGSGAPQAPGSFSGTIAAGTFTTVNLTWSDTNDGEAFYTLSRATALGGPYTTIAQNIDGSQQAYTDPSLSASTQYFYRLFAIFSANPSAGPSSSATFDITTSALPAAPDAPSAIVASPTSDATIALDITLGNTGTAVTTIEIHRSIITGGPYTLVGTISAPTLNTLYHYVDDNDLAPNATYFYVATAANQGGSSADSSEASATTFQQSNTFLNQSVFVFSPGSKTDIIQIGSRAVYISDSDRMVVFTNRAWFKGGIKRQLNAPTLAAQAGGALSADTYTIFTVLFSSRRNTRSLPSEGEDVVLAANETIRITPDLDTSGATDIVLVRDVAYDSGGNQILAADYVEFYMASSTSANAYLVAKVPVNDPIWDSTGYYELPTTLTTQAVFGSERRPMELLGESSLPPACSRGYAKDNRLILFGEKTFTPTPEETDDGALVAISTGDKTFTTTNYPLNDGMIYHELYLNGNPTGWEIYDIDEDTDTAYIRNADPDLNTQGYEGLGGSFSDFNFAARASRVYYSAFFTGEADGSTTLSPETFPPLTHFEAEFFPQDNTDPNAIITSNADLIMGKPSKMMLVRGGSEPDFPLINVISLSQSSGLNAPDTICRDSRDNVYYLGDSGPFMVSASGVTKLNVQSGNQNLFQEIFDINSMNGAQGTWFSQQDWMVVARLNRIGRSGFRDGFIYDPNLQLLCPFSTPFEITWMEEVKNIFGRYQILFGDKDGRLGILFKPGLCADGIDYTIAAPSLYAIPIKGYMRGPVFQTMNRICIRSFQPQIFIENGAVAKCTFSVAKKDRQDDPYSWNPQKVVQFDTDDKRTYFSVAPHSYQNAVVEFGFTMPIDPTNGRMSWREIILEMVNRGPI